MATDEATTTMRRAISVLIVLTAGACGPPAELFADASKDAEGKQFRPPAHDRAALYVVSPRYGVVDLSVGQRSLGPIADAGWVRADLRPGNYTIRCKSPVTHDPGARLDVELQAGQITYVSTDYVLLEFTCRLTPESPASGQAQVRAARRMRGISDPSD